MEGGADFIVAETFHNLGEAKLVLKAIKEFGKGLPAVVTVSLGKGGLWDTTMTYGEACKVLEDEGAAVVGLNCARGPNTMLPLLKDLRQICKGPIAALPVAYRTSVEHPTFQSLVEVENPENSAFPLSLDQWLCSRDQIAEFTRQARAIGVNYIGLCCGNRPHFLRSMAEALGRQPPASRYSPDMSFHYSRRKEERFRHTQGLFKNVYKTDT